MRAIGSGRDARGPNDRYMGETGDAAAGGAARRWWRAHGRAVARRRACLALLILALALAGCSIASGTPSGQTGTAAPAAPTASAVATTAGTTPGAGAAPVSRASVPAAAGAATAASPAASPAGAGASGGAAGGFPDVAGVADRVRPATVLVLNLVQGRGRGGQFPGRGTPAPGSQEVPQGAGTGFIIDPGGIIVTNNHVVAGAQSLRVQLPPPDNRFFDANLVGADPQTDLAVLKITGQNLPTVALGSSSQTRVGDWVVAIGNALALPGGPTVTAGVVSATGRDEQEPGEQPGTPGPVLYDLIQTDAAINPGNSGGPLVNLRGEVVGVNTLGATEAQGINFAISIDQAKPIVQQLRDTGKVTRGYLGVSVQSVTAASAAAAGLNATDGVVVQQVTPGSPAAQAGAQPGDVIVGIGDVAVHSQKDLQNALTTRYKPGDQVPLRINRGGSELTVQVTLGTRPQP
jgi:S1-C subfamily serine protease